MGDPFGSPIEVWAPFRILTLHNIERLQQGTEIAMHRRLSVIVLLLALVGPASPFPLKGVAQGQVYTDAMDSAGAGLLSTETFDPSISFAYENGQFVVDVAAPAYRGDITSTLNVPELASSSLTVDASIQGDPANKYVIAGCRHTDAGEGYFFGYLPATGDVLIWRRDAGGDTNIAEAVEPSLIAPVNATYQIGIDCWTNTITGIVNGQPVVSAFDATYASGRPTIGLGANGQQTDGLRVAFDNLSVTDNGNLELVTGPTVTPASATEQPAVNTAPAVDPASASDPALPPLQSSTGAEAQFDQTRAAAVLNPPRAAGLSGSFIEENDVYAYVSADVSLADFYTIATFTNPADLSAPFDVGIGFRDELDSESGLRFVITSDGTWYMQLAGQDPYASGAATGFVTTPGASNTIEILVQGSTGTIAVNGVLLPQFDLSTVMQRGDLYLGTGFFLGDTVAGREIAYSNWWVFPTDILDIPSG